MVPAVYSGTEQFYLAILKEGKKISCKNFCGETTVTFREHYSKEKEAQDWKILNYIGGWWEEICFIFLNSVSPDAVTTSLGFN